MEHAIVAAAVIGVGLIAAVAALAWPLYVKPKLRSRYEKNHHRRKREGGSSRRG